MGRIIALIGFIGSGKGTVAKILTKQHGFIQESMAKPVKDVAAVAFGWERELLEGATADSRVWRESKDDWWSQKLSFDVTPRKILQLIGTELFRDKIHQDFWIHCLENRIDRNKNYVISDVRFTNEIETLRNMGATICRVVRGPDPEYYETALNNPELMPKIYSSVHPSEWNWIGTKFDSVISNNSNLDELERNIRINLLDK